MPTLILGHRGSPLEMPENTPGSFRLALAQRADGVELDVHYSADGVPVVIHDETVDRTTRGAGRVADLPAAALAEFEVGRGERIPTLREVAEWAAGAGAWLNVELKAAGGEAATVEVLEAAGVVEKTIVSSFLPVALVAVGRLAPGMRRCLLTESWSAATAGLVARLAADGVCLRDDAATDAALREIIASRLDLIIWTVDDPARIRHLFDAGIAAIITNRPALAAAIRREWAGDRG